MEDGGEEGGYVVRLAMYIPINACIDAHWGSHKHQSNQPNDTHTRMHTPTPIPAVWGGCLRSPAPAARPPARASSDGSMSDGLLVEFVRG